MTVAAMQMALMKVWAQRSSRVAMGRQSLSFRNKRPACLIYFLDKLVSRENEASRM